MSTSSTKWSQFSILISVFFFWGFIAASNGILIPLYKEKLSLSQFQAQLIDFSFYGAYFIGSILYFIACTIKKEDILNRIGYKNGIFYGLLISTLGSLLFYPAATSHSFTILLSALFVVGLGFSLQQTSAQPFAVALGDPKTGAQRLNMAGGINNLGTTVGPVLVSFAIFGGVNTDIVNKVAKEITLDSVKAPYLIIGLAFFLVALLFKFSKLPKIVNEEKMESKFGALKHPQLRLGLLAIFIYVGAEVTIANNLGEYLKVNMNMDSSDISLWISLFWAGMMIGRLTASAGTFNVSNTFKKVLIFIIPFIAFGIYLGVNYLRGSAVSVTLPYALSIIIMILAFLFSQEKAARMQLVYSILGAIAMLCGIFFDGHFALFALISGGIFCSVMWPCIFHLSVVGLGKDTSQGSSFLIMMILGGGIVPLIQGKLSDIIGITNSYWVPFICFAILIWYSITVRRILIKRGIDFESSEGIKGGH